MIRDSQCWDRRTLRRCALHRKKLGPKDWNFWEPSKRDRYGRAIFGKIQRRNDSYLASDLAQDLVEDLVEDLAEDLAKPAGKWLTAAGMRGYSLMLLGFVVVAASDRAPDRNGRPIGLLAYKLQFGFLIPIALVASGR
jgi:hypothetical protein